MGPTILIFILANLKVVFLANLHGIILLPLSTILEVVGNAILFWKLTGMCCEIWNNFGHF